MRRLTPTVVLLTPYACSPRSCRTENKELVRRAVIVSWPQSLAMWRSTGSNHVAPSADQSRTAVALLSGEGSQQRPSHALGSDEPPVPLVVVIGQRIFR